MKLTMFDLSRRGFLKSSTLFLGGVAAQHLLLKTGISLVSAQTRPFRMLTLGDSVMWGQGLLENDKFSHQVKKWPEQDKGIAGVELKVMAHSGATITVGNDLDDDPKFRCLDGEINRSNPTITKQVSLAAEEYCSQNIPLEDVDLILLNGGINDINKLKLLRVTTRVGRIRNMASEYCDVEMKKLLHYAASTFPNARIIVTGYFPLITCSTPFMTVPYLLMQALGLKQPPPPQMIQVVEKSIPQGEEPKDYCQGLHPILRRLSLLSEAWRRESNAAFCRAAKWINQTMPWTTRVNRAASCVAPNAPPRFQPPDRTFELCTDALSSGAPIAQNRVFFASPEFKNENGYGVPITSYLWQLIPNTQPIPCTDGLLRAAQRRVIAEDTLRNQRPCWCCEAHKKNNVVCIRAGAFHPNVDGAKAYRNAIVKELEKVYADTGWGQVQWGTAPPSSSDHRTTGDRCTAPCPN